MGCSRSGSGLADGAGVGVDGDAGANVACGHGARADAGAEADGVRDAAIECEGEVADGSRASQADQLLEIGLRGWMDER